MNFLPIDYSQLRRWTLNEFIYNKCLHANNYQGLEKYTGYTQYKNAVERTLIDITPDSIGSLKGKAIKVGSGAGCGLAAGLAIGCLCASNPVGWVAGGLAACWGFFVGSGYVESKNAKIDRIHQEIKELVDKTLLIQLQSLQKNGLGLRQEIEDEHLKYLEVNNYIDFSNGFEFKNEKFDEIESCYPNGEGSGIVNVAKLIILSSMYVIKGRRLPKNKMIEELRLLLARFPTVFDFILGQRLSELPLKNFCHFILAQLENDLENFGEAMYQFKQISTCSDLYPSAQESIAYLNEQIELRPDLARNNGNSTYSLVKHPDTYFRYLCQDIYETVTLLFKLFLKNGEKNCENPIFQAKENSNDTDQYSVKDHFAINQIEQDTISTISTCNNSFLSVKDRIAFFNNQR